MNIALNPVAGFTQAFFQLLRRSRVAASQVTMIPAIGNMHDIQKGATLVVDNPLHREVVCLQGLLWITHDRDTKDIMLDAGEHYGVDRSTRMLIHALESARIRLV